MACSLLFKNSPIKSLQMFLAGSIRSNVTLTWFYTCFQGFLCARVKDKAVATANTTGGIRKAEDLFHSCDTKGQLEKPVSCTLGEVMGCTAVSIYVLTGSKWCFAREF